MSCFKLNHLPSLLYFSLLILGIPYSWKFLSHKIFKVFIFENHQNLWKAWKFCLLKGFQLYSNQHNLTLLYNDPIAYSITCTSDKAETRITTFCRLQESTSFNYWKYACRSVVRMVTQTQLSLIHPCMLQRMSVTIEYRIGDNLYNSILCLG